MNDATAVTSLFCHDDNELRQGSIEKEMLCLIETAVDKDKDIILLQYIMKQSQRKGEYVYIL